MLRLALTSFIAVVPAAASEAGGSRSALESDPQGWKDIMPGADLAGWYRVPVPPGGKLGREQWHLDESGRILVCDGDGGHDMLLTRQEYADAIFHLEFRYTRVEGKTGYNSGAYVRNSRDGELWHQAQFGDASDGYLFGESRAADGSRKFFTTQKALKEKRVKPAGEWNVMEITASGNTLVLWVNGAVTARFDGCGVPQGHVGVEGENYRIEFRNLKIKPLTPAGAARPASAFSKPVIDMGMVVSDLERSAKFYTESLGMVEVKGFSVTGELGRKIGLIDNHPVDIRVFVPAESDGATRIKMMSFPGVSGKAADQSFIHSALGIRYLTMYVASADATLERLAKAGVKPIGETPVSLGNNLRLITVRDPDGNFIELIGP
jgi:catechol 2,3-dioxygenase-like lactoylglutathione lyase family enzyme